MTSHHTLVWLARWGQEQRDRTCVTPAWNQSPPIRGVQTMFAFPAPHPGCREPRTVLWVRESEENLREGISFLSRKRPPKRLGKRGTASNSPSLSYFLLTWGCLAALLSHFLQKFCLLLCFYHVGFPEVCYEELTTLILLSHTATHLVNSQSVHAIWSLSLVIMFWK